MTTAWDFTATDINGVEQDLRDFRQQAALVVNTASACGFTPQYGPLQELYTRYRDRGFVVLGFPCDQFGHQEPGTESEIAEFCESTYGVEFPMFAKIDVNGKNAHPLFQWLKSERKGLLGGAIKWNFTKFLIDSEGQVVARYGSATNPAEIADDIEALLER